MRLFQNNSQEKKYADNKVGFLLGVNYFAKSSIKGSGIIGSLIYDSHLHNIFSLTGEFARSIVYLDGLYWGDFSYNGIGDLHGGYGYQIKISEAVSDFNVCD